MKNIIGSMCACLIPVVVLYFLFGQLNYFGLEGHWKGVVGAGPIAAYIFLYWRTLSHLTKTSKPLIEEEEIKNIEKEEGLEVPDITGTWKGTWPWNNEETGKTSIWEETVRIDKQKGRFVTGYITDLDGQNTAFVGQVFSRMLTFFYVSNINSRISCGSTTVKINPTAQNMEGHQIYYDLELEELIPTKYSLVFIRK